MIAERPVLAEQVGLSTTRLQRINAMVQTFIDRGIVSGAVTLVARQGCIAHRSATGQLDIAANQPMQPDTIFRLASMTKPVIAVAILMLLEEGKLLLSDPVSHFLPVFKGVQVAVPNARTPMWMPTQLTPGEYHLEPPQREITIRDLLTHTSGFGSATVGPGAAAQAALSQERRRGETLAEVIPEMATVPLSFQPGTAWEYSPAFGFDTLGRIVEVVSGQSIDHFLQRRLFDPLGMSETGFGVRSDKLARVATPYARTPDGMRPCTPIRGLALSTDPDNRYFSGGGGLAGTAADYARFAAMLAAGGQLDRERILSRRTVGLMASNHIGQLPLDRSASDMSGYRFGLGVRVLENAAEAATLASPGTFGWAGAFGTNSFIDPAAEMVGLLMIQRISDFQKPEADLRTLWPRFQTTAYQALDD